MIGMSTVHTHKNCITVASAVLHSYRVMVIYAGISVLAWCAKQGHQEVDLRECMQELVQVESLAQVGVQLLLFTLGLEFSLQKLRAVRSVALIGAALPVLVTADAAWTLAAATTCACSTDARLYQIN